MAVPPPQPAVWIRLALLLALPAVGWAVWWDGQHYDPALLDFRNAAKAGSAASLAGKFPEKLGPFVRLAPPRTFHKDNLFEYINGHAEYFLSAGFKGLAVGEYGLPGATQPTLVIDLYDMDQPAQAFGVLSDEAGQGAEPAEAGEMGFRVGQGLSFIFGPYYLHMAGFGETGELTTLANEWTQRLGTKGGGLTFDFPPLGPVVSSRFIKESYRGMGFLHRVMERTFEWQGLPVTLFSAPLSPEGGKALWGELAQFFQKEKIPVTERTENGLTYHVVEDRYEGEWFLIPLPDRLLGVFAPPSPELLAPLREFALGRQRPS
ncbi:MAG: hypothetical protein HQL51_00570 [Magnetococcales bacterium]|nr:hypothetical protein [Magnetococcales bacterium]